MKRLCSFAALVLLSTPRMLVLCFHLKSKDVWSTSTPQADVLLCVHFGVEFRFHGSNYRRGSRKKPASKTVSAREDKARAPAGTLIVELGKNTERRRYHRSFPHACIDDSFEPVVVSTEPTKAPSIDMPAPPATVAGRDLPHRLECGVRSNLAHRTDAG